ncbi:MAG: tetratricopeptide repeat protein [Pseudonocardiaceae bacterium]
MPNPDDLPKKIESLPQRQAVHLDLENFRVRIGTLIEAITQAPAVSKGKPSVQHDVAGARATYEQAIISGDSEKVAIAALRLGILLDKEGHLTGARAVYQNAISSGHHDYAPAAARSLEQLK